VSAEIAEPALANAASWLIISIISFILQNFYWELYTILTKSSKHFREYDTYQFFLYVKIYPGANK